MPVFLDHKMMISREHLFPLTPFPEFNATPRARRVVMPPRHMILAISPSLAAAISGKIRRAQAFLAPVPSIRPHMP